MADKTTYQLAMTLKYNRDGSPDARSTRHRELNNIVAHLQEHRGYSKRWNIHKFDVKDANRLVHDWKQNNISHRTIKNRLAHVRWLANHVNPSNNIPSRNRNFGISKNEAPKQKAEKIDSALLNELPEREKLITELRVEFGLRTEEAIKFSHSFATSSAEDKIKLKENWCKGGRSREIAITNERQRDLLFRIQQHQNNNHDRSMIPNHRTYKSYYRDYNELRESKGLKGHEYRHQWAQNRFHEISGIKAPHAGGTSYNELNKQDQARYRYAARIVNQELGHGAGRNDTTATYIGK